ncbi:MAG: RraA family protein [Alphaproteobacteria bacterium]
MTVITADDLRVLAQWDTPTICNALEMVMPERRGHGFTVEPFSCLDPALPPMVGFARTAKIRAAAPDLSPGGKGMADRIPYYEYVANGPGPTIVVIEDMDPKPGVGAFWGEVHTALHKGLGALGVVTNGSYRDIPDSAPGFQILGGMVGPSHAFVRTVDFNCPVTVHGMEVAHGNIIHADRHGAVVVPAESVGRIADAVDLISRKEARILEASNADDFDIEKLKQTIHALADVH